MKTIKETYRERLLLLSKQCGGHVELSKKINKSPAQISQWINGSADSKTGKARSMKSETAREIEFALNLPHGWFDQPIESLGESTLKERLQELMEEYGLTKQIDLAKFANVSKGLVNQWFSGETGLGIKPLLELDRKTQFSPQWLADGTGAKYKKEEYEISPTLKFYNINYSRDHNNLITKFPELLTAIEIPKKFLIELLGITDLNELYFLSPNSDTMEPTIPKRSIIIVKTDINKFQNNGIYLITYNGHTTINRLAKNSSGIIKVLSDNNFYSDTNFDINPNEIDKIVIHGKLWKVLPLNFLNL